MNARELLDSLAALPGVRPVTAQSTGIEASVLVNGIEVACAADAGERTLRAAWRARTRGGATPLLLVADDPEQEGILVSLGPVGHDGPLRSVETGKLTDVLRRSTGLPALQAVRDLAEQLEHLDLTGVAGLTVRGLGTEHLFRDRLRATADWMQLSALGAGIKGPWRQALTGAGYAFEELPQRGYLGRVDGAPVIVVHPVADVSAFAKLDAEKRPPEGLLIEACRHLGAPYGILAAGTRLRLFEAAPESGSAVARYLELDTEALGDADRPLLGLLAPPYLAQGQFARLMADARMYGVGLRKRLDTAIRQLVLPPIGLALGQWAREAGRDLASDPVRRDLEAAALTFVFRALFLLYAESAGFLPMGRDAYARGSFTGVIGDAAGQKGRFDARSTKFWDRTQLLVRAMRSGDDALGVPAYNGDLFAPDGFDGSATLEAAVLSDAALGPALVALGIESETGGGYDFSGLEVGHLGHIYEGLLSLRLSVADRDYRYEARRDRYIPAAAGDADAVPKGELLWLTDEGGRKGGGVYYTPEPLVRHLVRRGVLPAFERHLEGVAALVRTDPDKAARELFRFRVLDPSCGSAHFLVAVVDELADRVALFLSQHPLPQVAAQLDDLRAGAGATYGVGVEDAALLRRLVLRRCVYGVDLSPMGAEIAKISLWLASFVPGLSLAFLDHNIRIGNSLIGVGSPDQLLDDHGGMTIPAMLVLEQMERAAKATEALFDQLDRTPEEVRTSELAEEAAQHEVDGARMLLDLWVAGPLGLDGARQAFWSAAEEVRQGKIPEIALRASALARKYSALHWPIAFPEVFSQGGGFDAIVGNPPWEKIVVPELEFFARYSPGLEGLAEELREQRLHDLRRTRVDLVARLESLRDEVEVLRRYFGGNTGYQGSPGDPDLYKFFCQRYRILLCTNGVLAIVLPRGAFLAAGSADFRKWIFRTCAVDRIDFLVNARRWAFDAEGRQRFALVIARADAPSESAEIAGVADSGSAFARQASLPGLRVSSESLGAFNEIPMLRSQSEADLLHRLRVSGTRFPFGGGRWKCFPVVEFHESRNRSLWHHATSGIPLWKGESFDQWDPHGRESRQCPRSAEAEEVAAKRRPGSDSALATASLEMRVNATEQQRVSCRIAFRNITRSDDSRTMRSVLAPPLVYLTHAVSYLVFLEGAEIERAAALGVLNSLVFDWQVRRYVDVNMSFFLLEGLQVPEFDNATLHSVAAASARLSCPDDRFASFAAATGVAVGPLEPAERDRLRAEIDAQVACAWGLDAADLETIFADFTLDAVPEVYRGLVRERLAALLDKFT